jgi:hypothetical protein
MKKLVVLTVLMAIGCQNKEDMLVARDYQIFFEQNRKPEIIGNDTIPPPPLPGAFYYSDVNFLVEEGTTYYFKVENIEKQNSCMPIQKTDFRPEFIGITPNDIIEIPTSEFETTFHENIRPEYGKGFFSLASAKDTFYSKEWSIIMKEVSADKKNNWLWIVRKMTQEEKVVLEHKKSGKEYDPKAIAWDTTTIILPKAGKK